MWSPPAHVCKSNEMNLVFKDVDTICFCSCGRTRLVSVHFQLRVEMKKYILFSCHPYTDPSPAGSSTVLKKILICALHITALMMEWFPKLHCSYNKDVIDGYGYAFCYPQLENNLFWKQKKVLTFKGLLGIKALLVLT